MKKAVTFAVAALMALTLVGCSSSSKEETEAATQAAAEAEETESLSEWEEEVAEDYETESVSEKIEDDLYEESELEEMVAEYETDTEFSSEDIESFESTAAAGVASLESEVEDLED